MAEGADVSAFNELERRALEILTVDSRISVSQLAERLGVSKATASRVIKSLRAKGVRFTVDVDQGFPRAFIVSKRPHGDEAYRLIDGRYLTVIKARDFNELVQAIESIKDREEVYIAVGTIRRSMQIPKLTCDYCGGPISGTPIIYRRGRRTYYLCCRTCLRELKKKLKVRE